MAAGGRGWLGGSPTNRAGRTNGGVTAGLATADLGGIKDDTAGNEFGGVGPLPKKNPFGGVLARDSGVCIGFGDADRSCSEVVCSKGMLCLFMVGMWLL